MSYKDRIRLAAFIRQNTAFIDYNIKELLGLFNELGKKYDSEQLQLGFLESIIETMLKASNTPKDEQKKLLTQVLERLK